MLGVLINFFRLLYSTEILKSNYDHSIKLWDLYHKEILHNT